MRVVGKEHGVAALRRVDEELVFHVVIEIQVVILARLDALAHAVVRRNAAKLLAADPILHVHIFLVQFGVRLFLLLAGQVEEVGVHLVAVNLLPSVLKRRKIRVFRILDGLLNRRGIALQIVVGMHAGKEHEIILLRQ